MFVERPATTASIAKRKAICGVGINDAPYVVTNRVNGRVVFCPFYTVWHSMIARCYSGKSRTYADCEVDARWHQFTAFRAWMVEQDWRNNHLDKDILHPGNKVYSPQNCIFVAPEINKLVQLGSHRGDLPPGVCRATCARGKFQAGLTVNGKSKHLGYFESAEAAGGAYRTAKAALIRSAARRCGATLRGALERFARHVELLPAC